MIETFFSDSHSEVVGLALVAIEFDGGVDIHGVDFADAKLAKIFKVVLPTHKEVSILGPRALLANLFSKLWRPKIGIIGPVSFPFETAPRISHLHERHLSFDLCNRY